MILLRNDDKEVLMSYLDSLDHPTICFIASKLVNKKIKYIYMLIFGDIFL